jgi:transcriptional regulator with XRE-family HTH domain
LPDDWVLLQKRDAEGYSGKEIAALYGVSPQAVSNRFKKMRRANPGFLHVLPWRLRQGDKALYAALRLKAHIQERRGEELSHTALKRLRDWRERLRRDHVVLDYQPVDVGSPWLYVPREEIDNELVIRWPAEAEPPTAQQRGLLELPPRQEEALS